jgi:hypothetical protein
MVSLPRLVGNPRLSREGTAAPRLREYTAPPDGELIWSRTGKAQLDKDHVNVLDAQKRRRMFCLLFFCAFLKTGRIYGPGVRRPKTEVPIIKHSQRKCSGNRTFFAFLHKIGKKGNLEASAETDGALCLFHQAEAGA